MTKLRPYALFFIATCAAPTWAAGSNVYKCGSTYSQTPCDGAVAVRVDDTRSKEQKSQSDAAIVQQGKTANAMEKARLKEEARAIAQSQSSLPATKPNSKAKANSGTSTAPKGGKSDKKDSEFFIAKEAAPAKKK